MPSCKLQQIFMVEWKKILKDWTYNGSADKKPALAAQTQDYYQALRVD